MLFKNEITALEKRTKETIDTILTTWIEKYVLQTERERERQRVKSLHIKLEPKTVNLNI